MSNLTRLCIALIAAAVPAALALHPSPRAFDRPQTPHSWNTDPAWNQGKAEWALYDASRIIYGKPRRYEATIFTNKQLMNPTTTTKTDDPSTPGAFEVFKHNVSELIPIDHYTYRFLTTCFIRTDNFEPYKVVMSSQEDCGTTYKQFTFAGGLRGKIDAVSYCYFPETGFKHDEWTLPGMSEHFRFHDDLTLTLRRFPFDDPASADVMMKLIPDQTDAHETSSRLFEAQIHYEGRETLEVPYGRVEAHHLRVTHEKQGGESESHYWFAADSPTLRHVLVKYAGPYGVKYELKRLGWWRYWDQSEPRPE